MDKIDKSLKKFSSAELRQIKKLLSLLSSGDTKGLDIKKLKGRDDIYRVRKGRLRVICRQINGDIFLLVIERRNEGTYKDF